MNHIALTLADLVAARDRANLLIAGLQEFQIGMNGGTTTAPPAQETCEGPEAGAGEDTHTPARPPCPAPEKPPSARAAAPPSHPVPRGTAKQAAKPAKATVGTQNPNTAKVARLAEPFRSSDIATACGLSVKQASNYIQNRLLKDGWVRRVGFGRYERTKSFPVTPPVKAVLPPSPGFKRLDFGKAHGNARPSRAPQSKPVTPPATVTARLEKPASLGRAMKLLLAQHPQIRGAALRDLLLADVDYAKLMEQSPTGFSGNLVYWANQGFLEKTGGGEDASYTVTDAGREWFQQ